MTWLERAKKVIPGGAQTRSKSHLQFGEGVYPSHAMYASGCSIQTADIPLIWMTDWISALGSNILGYNTVHPNYQLVSLSLPSAREVILAEELVKRLPFIDMVRFASNGMDVTTCAIRLARAFTGKLPFVSIGYHGHSEIFSCGLPLNGGTNPRLKADIIEYEFNELEMLCSDMEEPSGSNNNICAVIIEYPPIKQENWSYIHKLSQRLQAICNKTGVVLIIDEVLTFLRAKQWCISNELGIQPDLICGAKALANGYPLSFIGGKENIMGLMGDRGSVFFSNTFSGCDTSVSAAIECLKLYDDNQVYKKIHDFGTQMMNMIDIAGMEFGFHAVGDPFRFKIHHKNPLKEKILAQQLVKRKHLTMPSGYIIPNYSHTTQLNMVVITTVFKEAMEASMTAKLEGIESKPLLLQNR